MSAAEIADNKWESESTKPPVFTVGSLAQIGLMGLFGLFFAYILVMSVVAIVKPKEEAKSLEDQFGGSAPAADAK